MSNKAHIVTHQDMPLGFRVEVEHDDISENPRKEWDNAATIALASSSRYDFGDEELSVEEMRDIAKSTDYICLPVYAYIHSGITISTGGFSCPWDSGQLGIVYISKADALKEWGTGVKKRISPKMLARVREYLKGEVETLDHYLTGQVYGYRVYGPEDADGEREEMDSCWGFYGDEKDALREGVFTAEYRIEEEKKHRRSTWLAALAEAREARYWAQRGMTTVAGVGVAA